jgi:hypothetical protein
MKEYLQFLRRHPLWWLAPIALYLGAFAWLAGSSVHAPENPFNYSAR